MIKKLSLVQELLQETIIKRETYLQSIQKYWDAKLIKVITGMRRVGKSSLLKTILQQAVALYHIPYENIFYINKELPFFNNIKTYDDLEYHFQSFLSTIVKDKKILIAIDEIQDIQEWEKFINGYLAQYGQKVEIFITGSNSLMLSSELSTYLTGRYIEFEVFPLSLTEYALFSQQPITKPLFLDYLQYGGLPGIFYMQKEEEVIFNYLQGIYATIILKDIVKYF
jgi:predicted AAA+ superfamily ATPase